MSNNARESYSNGEKPKSRWTKAEILSELADLPYSKMEIVKGYPVKELREEVLVRTSWHHTSSHYNRTDFYMVSIDKAMNLKPYKKSAISVPKEEHYEAVYLEWSGTRKHPKAEEIVATGTIKGNWFYLPDGTKKSTTARGFRIIRKV